MKHLAIETIRALEILDSRGNPTVECTVALAGGAQGRASVPSGASTGQYEACELRDGDTARYGGKGVLRAVGNIEGVLAPALCGCDASDLSRLDEQMRQLDDTPNKQNLGANALLAVSLASARAAAAALGQPLFRFLGGTQADTLPVPMMNILNGGAHAANNLDVQEFMILPVGAANFTEGLRQGTEIYHSLRGVLQQRGLATGVGDEGGFAPDLASDEQAIELILEAVEKAGYAPGRDVVLALDAAASEWADGQGYRLPKNGQQFDTDGLIAHFEALCAQYPIRSIEDPLGENDFAGFAQITRRLGGERMIVGDDLFVTNTQRLARGIEEKAGNAILVKVNQIGTLTEAIAAVNLAKRAGFATIISHRSGETEDSFIADLAVALNAGFIKTGAPCRTERVCKYNRLLAIEQQLGGSARYGV